MVWPTDSESLILLLTIKSSIFLFYAMSEFISLFVNPVCLLSSSNNLKLLECCTIVSVVGFHLYMIFGFTLIFSSSSEPINSPIWYILLMFVLLSLNATKFRFTAVKRFAGTLIGGFTSLLIVSVTLSACKVA